jgi:two-component system, OmpR family, alkaline phosphatase synthesis response regulator PhoP
MVTVLLIDDEQNLVELIQSYLEKENYRVLTANNGAEGLRLANSEQPDLIVLDLMLPLIDGIEVCRRIRQVSPVYIIMLTAKAEEVDRIVGLSVGADDYLTKPFSPRELVARIKALLRRPRNLTQEFDTTPPPRRFGEL